MSEKISCRTCCFFEKTGEEEAEDWGLCRAALPRIIHEGSDEPSIAGYWPGVSGAVDWCGHHKPKECGRAMLWESKELGADNDF